MWTAREAMATTSLEEVTDMEKGLWGRGIVLIVGLGDAERWWMWRVESQDEEMRRLCEGEKVRDLAPAVWEERTVWDLLLRSILCADSS